MSHLDNLQIYFPDLPRRKILDIGAGRGGFLINSSKKGFQAAGVEKNEEYIKKALDKAEEEGVNINIIKGDAQALPFADGSFEFVNISEVIEHVDEPVAVVSEAARVLKSGGGAYLSAPNRFGFYDPHFHLYFINWLPRFLSEFLINLFGREKNYEERSAGRQKLSEMHYYSLKAIKSLLGNKSFSVIDTREEKIKSCFRNKFLKNAGLLFYRTVGKYFFDTFHFILVKQ